MKTKKGRDLIKKAQRVITEKWGASDKIEYKIHIVELEKKETGKLKVTYQLECIPFPDCCEIERMQETEK